MELSPVYSYDTVARYADCDLFDRLRPAALLREVQQASMEHSEALGVGRDTLLARGQAFLLAQQTARFARPILGAQKLHIVTKPAIAAFLYPRETVLYAPQGEELARVTAQWVLVDTASMRILRRPPQELVERFPQHKGVSAMVKLPRPDELALQPCGERTVEFALADTNRHLNNAACADVVCDALGDLLSAEKRLWIQEITVIYHEQLPLNAAFCLKRAVTGHEAQVFGFGKANGEEKLCFQARVLLSDEEATL